MLHYIRNSSGKDEKWLHSIRALVNEDDDSKLIIKQYSETLGRNVVLTLPRVKKNRHETSPSVKGMTWNVRVKIHAADTGKSK